MADAPPAFATSVVMSGRQSLALGAHPTSPLSRDRRPGGLVSGKGAAAPLPSPWVTARWRIVLTRRLPPA
jgi:hypothetical protein